MIEPLDQQYFKIMLAENYNEEEYSDLDKMFTKASKIATNDELFYLALNGNTFVRVHSISPLIERNDKRIIYLYRYYSEFPLSYKQKMGCVISDQDMALSNIRSKIIYSIKNFEDYQYIKEKDEKELRLFFSEDEIRTFEDFKLDDFKNYLNEFNKIDKKFIPNRIETLEMIKQAWKDEKIQSQY
ncbi:hypothetical protein NZ698_15630 [Chryseobacterium sp. PBS4-4]|uniref:Uncharacterized protein n=1 Tax=Chryseobacterium edaphi TaxID=2976532 RepID=A0ABT2W8U4_9FLAO|nr:hypothetical protein [Chryseobacterium edaphi]MCU7618625.1 hypothetical protein [Chryseobacterium edaphi]